MLEIIASCSAYTNVHARHPRRCKLKSMASRSQWNACVSSLLLENGLKGPQLFPQKLFGSGGGAMCKHSLMIRGHPPPNTHNYSCTFNKTLTLHTICTTVNSMTCCTTKRLQAAGDNWISKPRFCSRFLQARLLKYFVPMWMERLLPDVVLLCVWGLPLPRCALPLSRPCCCDAKPFFWAGFSAGAVWTACSTMGPLLRGPCSPAPGVKPHDENVHTKFVQISNFATDLKRLELHTRPQHSTVHNTCGI